MKAVSKPLEDYALIGDTHTAALVGRDGSIDWLCLPRFDSGACFAALLGDRSHGRWLLAPAGGARRTTRRYRGDTMVLETEFETGEGAVRLIEFMPHRHRNADVVRIVEGVRGRVPMRMELILRFDYGWVVPWVYRAGGGLSAVAGPDACILHTPVETRGVDLTTVAEFEVSAGDRIPFVLTWYPSADPTPDPVDAERSLRQTERAWERWAARCTYRGPRRDAVMRSLLTLKALTYEPTGGVVAAATTSLPEKLGGVRNWDYRFCWLRDSALVLYALLISGYEEEARAWRRWLLRAAAGDPAQLQIMYGPAGERRLPELELPWLPGYEGSRPVRVGNAAARQFQLDVYGEVVDTFHVARRAGLDPDPYGWALERNLLEFVEEHWREPDEGIWEVRGPRRHFTSSKVMAWVAFDRAVKAVERFGLEGPVDEWKRLRSEIHDEVTSTAFDAERNTFTQYPGSRELDASLLLMPLVGFLPSRDPRVRGTLDSIQRELCQEGFVMRYSTSEADDGLPPGEGAFVACTFWLADNLVLARRLDEAEEVFEKLLAIRNDVGLLAEEYDTVAGRQVGNFPQAFSHVALVNTAWNLHRAGRGG